MAFSWLKSMRKRMWNASPRQARSRIVPVKRGSWDLRRSIDERTVRPAEQAVLALGDDMPANGLPLHASLSGSPTLGSIHNACTWHFASRKKDEQALASHISDIEAA
jgi:hypothetical protein